VTGPVASTLGNRIAPPRFVLFVAVLLIVAGAACGFGAKTYGDALVVGFDTAALVFIASLWPIMRSHSAAQMRKHAAENDARRGLVLVLTALVALALLGSIVSELPDAKAGHAWPIVKLVGTLALSWVYTNLVFMLHYAHLHYGVAPSGKGDHGGFEFPGTKEPDYWDFLYFAFTAGMSFAASDVDVTRGAVRRIVVLHSLLSFVFNIGVLAFSINVLAGAAGN
jgi:uncharacterized membrane protein